MCDIQMGNTGLIVTLCRSKTDQEGASFTKGIPIGTSDATFPKCALEAWLLLAESLLARSFDQWIAGGMWAIAPQAV